MKVAIIGGTGLEKIKLFNSPVRMTYDTPYGVCSNIIHGKIGNMPCLLLLRHGEDHDVAPSYINYRANIWALKMAGADVIIATSASGSLNELIKPGHIVLIDSIIDRTTQRIQTFYDGAENHPRGVCHIPCHSLFNDKLRNILKYTANTVGLNCRMDGTSICIEGPRYSTVAESKLYQSWGADLVNMTVCPEAILAKELGMIYASVAIVTDFDCWIKDKEVSVNVVNESLKGALENFKNFLLQAVLNIDAQQDIIHGEINEAKKIAKEAVINSDLIEDLSHI